ncbi:MAG: S-layer protein, partial [Synergistaceae bacterium]|nr:S-layer protein [Synergistaceae bacterium]
VISGYPDGSFKGAQPSTRYEVASVIARGLAKIDLEKASKQDVEMLKKLIVEFKDELDALGVKVDKIDERVAVLEKDLGGWFFSGELRFDARFTGEGDGRAQGWYGDELGQVAGKNEFDLNRYRLYINKRIDENTTFTARLVAGGSNNGNRPIEWELYYVTTKLPYDVTFTAGLQELDLESDLGLYADEDAWFGDNTLNALTFSKSWGMADFLISVGRINDDQWDSALNNQAGATVDNVEGFLAAANVNLNFNEKIRAGLLGYWLIPDKEYTDSTGADVTDSDLSTYGAYAGFKFTPDIELKAIYYWQSQGTSRPTYVPYEDSANAWKAMLEVGQDTLKFTSLWLEYGQLDNNFERLGGANPYSPYGAELLANQPVNLNTTKIIAAFATQEWSDKWRTFERFVRADFDTTGFDNATNWTFGVGYRYSPAIDFELSYDNIDYGTNTDPNAARQDDDHQINFRTYISF